MSQDSILFNSSYASGGSRLLSETPFPSGSGLSSSGEDDLSISELSLSDNPETALENPEDLERVKKHTGRLRDEKLQNDAFVLKKLNATLSSFNDALGDVGSQNERVAAQLKQTEGLLDRYVAILSGSEQFARLIFDEQWQGSEADEMILAQEQREAQERARRVEAERVAAAQREQERLQREALDHANQRERERAEREKSERATARGGVRGVRGTRASMRAATRGVGRGAAASSGRPPTSAARGSSTARGIGRST